MLWKGWTIRLDKKAGTVGIPRKWPVVLLVRNFPVMCFDHMTNTLPSFSKKQLPMFSKKCSYQSTS
jgi:hypothetical protein